MSEQKQQKPGGGNLVKQIQQELRQEKLKATKSRIKTLMVELENADKVREGIIKKIENALLEGGVTDTDAVEMMQDSGLSEENVD